MQKTGDILNEIAFLVLFDLCWPKAGFHLNECNDSAEAARVGACVVGSKVDSPAADLGRIG